MKVTERKRNKKSKIKVNMSKPVPKQKVMIVAQELKFARLLAGNEKKTRDKVLKTLSKWLKNCFQKGYEFKEEDFLRVWKGIFYAVWMSDKPLVQEELCEHVSGILDEFPPENVHHAMMMVKAGFKVLATEWYGIDQHRIDKFLMLVRRYLRGALRALRRCDWSDNACRLFADAVGKNDGIFAPQTPMYARNAISMVMHVADCYIEEISKVSEGGIPESALAIILSPLATYCGSGVNPRLCVSARKVFTQLARQSEAGRELEDRTVAWQKMGCPKGGPEALEPASDDDDNEHQQSDDDEDDDRKPLDPRAGRVNVFLTPIPTASSLLVEQFRTLLTTAKGASHTRVKNLMKTFQRLSTGEAPFPSRIVDVDINDEVKIHADKAAEKLRNLQAEVAKDETRELLKSLSRRQRKRLLAKARSGISIAEDLKILGQIKEKTATTNGDWAVEEESTAVEKKAEKKKTKKRKIEDSDSNKKSENDSPKKIKLLVKSSPKNKSNTKLEKDTKQSTPKNRENNNKTKNHPKIIDELNATSPRMPEKLKLTIKEKPTQKKAVTKSEKLKIIVKSKEDSSNTPNINLNTPKKVKFVLKNNSMQKPIDYFKSVRQSPNIPFDGSKQPSKTNLKPSTPSPINPFFKKKLKLKF